MPSRASFAARQAVVATNALNNDLSDPIAPTQLQRYQLKVWCVAPKKAARQQG